MPATASKHPLSLGLLVILEDLRGEAFSLHMELGGTNEEGIWSISSHGNLLSHMQRRSPLCPKRASSRNPPSPFNGII
ncbi:hypothetical protein DL95DRAFT_380658, partial [Leptodontidium sp. 2 PMI_412]